MSGVSVEKGETGVRVQAEAPHLVSLGGGRLSTAITIHPLPNGTTVLGSGKHVDIIVGGLGVEEQHCYIENNRGVITLHSKSPRTTIDGLPVTQPTRLSQGCILGLGHSSYFRFNHPDQARMIKKSLPDPKASMLPLTFYQGACVSSMDGNSPLHHQESRSRDNYSSGNNYSNKNGLSNGDLPNGEMSPRSWKPSLPSPSYNRDPTPYTPSKPPLHTSSPIQFKLAHPQEKSPKSQDSEALELEEILAICSEYQRENQIERSMKPVQNRIKTNGSLPREKRLNSPTSPSLQHSFTFDTRQNHLPETPTMNPYFKNYYYTNTYYSFSDMKNNSDKQKDGKIHTYENVIFNSGSPRPRIKTFLSKENTYNLRDNISDGCPPKFPVITNIDSSKSYSENSLNSCCNSKFNESNGPQQMITSLTSNLDGIKERDRSSGEFQDKGRPSSIADITAEKKYNFLGFDPRKEELENAKNNKHSYELLRCTSLPPTNIPNSPPSWTNPTLDFEFPDYDHVNGIEDEDSENSKRLSINNNSLNTSKNNSLVEELKIEREHLMKNISLMQEKISELELQEEELIRESEIEEALVVGEIAAQDEKLKQDEQRIKNLKERLKECDSEKDKCLQKQNQSQDQFKIVSEKHLAMIDILERKISSCENEDMRVHLVEALKEQQELLDSERRTHEVLEFQLVEEEASWLSKREDLQREIEETEERLKARKEKVTQLHQPNKVNNLLEIEKISHLKAIEEGRTRLKKIDDELQLMSKSFPSVDSLISCNSESRAIRRRVTSQDDLDRISKVTSGAPIDMGSSNSLGRRTIASLKEIERNRQLHLINQGSLVIEEERQRVEELKRQVQDEVKAKWEQQRNSNCQSLTSITSDDSSLEPTRDSGVSSEEVEKHLPTLDEKNGDTTNSIDQTLSSETPESRPLSDASGYSDDQLTVKIRNKSSNLQRPLTRYLPIKSETLDLRAHIESAGHQVELCPHVKLDSLSCRGYLSKVGSRFKTLARRWFVFDRAARTLSYYSDSSEKKKRGGVHFQNIEEVYVDHLNTFKSPNSKVTFVVKSSSRSFHLIAPSAEAMRIWVDVIFTGAEGYQLYPQH